MSERAAFRRIRQRHRQTARAGVQPYRLDVPTPPTRQSVEIAGPGYGIRWLREGSHDFSSFAELAKTVASPGMTDVEKAMAVYRFSFRYATHGGMGWGATEMTRFLNAFGYSFCWGQADFQHLLFEAVGLPARAPGLVGHSSEEVLIDGRWCMFDAFMQLVLPAPELDGLATGKELMDNPWIIDACRSVPERVKTYQEYWSKHVASNTYEPWQDSRTMMLSLRRGEKLRIDYGRREAWCVAPGEPPDHVNGEWTWQPKLDAEHVETEIDLAENVAAVDGGLGAVKPKKPACVDYLLHSPYPFCAGTAALKFAGETEARVSVSTDGRKTWTVLHDGPAGKFEAALDKHLSQPSLPNIGQATPAALIAATICDVILRVEWTGDAVLHDVRFAFLVQINAPSLPKLAVGANRWRLIGCTQPGAITHEWDEFPGLDVSDATPWVGDDVGIAALVHNRTDKEIRRVPVRFTLTETDIEIGTAVVPSIPAGGAAEARITWRADIVPTRGNTGRSDPKRYVNTIIEARVGDETDGEWTGVARAEVVVRPLPVPRFVDELVWSSDARHAHENRLVLRAALVNEIGRDLDARLTYVPDSPLAATLTPYLGHPDEGGVPLDDPVRLTVEPTEFEVAEWALTTESLPKRFDVWVEVVCDGPVAPEHQRLLARRRVRRG